MTRGFPRPQGRVRYDGRLRGMIEWGAMSNVRRHPNLLMRSLNGTSGGAADMAGNLHRVDAL